jgi:glycosyltransferase involved in cell wall biosynthesis
MNKPYDAGTRLALDFLNQRLDENSAHLKLKYLIIYQSRPDLQEAFPDIWGVNYQGFGQWINTFATTEYNLPEQFPLLKDWLAFSWGKLFVEWFNTDQQPYSYHLPLLSRFAFCLYRSRPDLQKAFPYLFGKDRLKYLAWFVIQAAKEYQLPDFLIEPVRQSLPKHLKLETFINRLRGEIALPNPPETWFAFLKQKTDFSLAQMRHAKPKYRKYREGFNLAGHFREFSGIGEATRATLRSIQPLKLPYNLVEIDPAIEVRYPAQFFRLNIIHGNSAYYKEAAKFLGGRFLWDKYNIGYWYWELSELPQNQFHNFKLVDEIWVASDFVYQAVKKNAPVPVFKIPPSIVLPLNNTVFTRAEFGLPNNTFIFLAIFSLYSIIERKNPFGLIEAFRLAFEAANFSDVCLVLKIKGLKDFPLFARQLQAKIKGLPVRIIEANLEAEKLGALISRCDCLVSLHRSEGFGLTLAEAMALGKPTIATAYSGNTDFTNEATAFPVKYKLVELEQDYLPYPKGAVWAEPDIEHAATRFQIVYGDSQRRETIAQAGKSFIETHYKTEKIAPLIKARLEALS